VTCADAWLSWNSRQNEAWAFRSVADLNEQPRSNLQRLQRFSDGPLGGVA
jgi:hypothetical protein